jgi:hypothetical protein
VRSRYSGRLGSWAARQAGEIRGSKRVWTAVSFINFAGPICYFAFGRRRVS